MSARLRHAGRGRGSDGLTLLRRGSLRGSDGLKILRRGSEGLTPRPTSLLMCLAGVSSARASGLHAQVLTLSSTPDPAYPG